MFVRKFHLLDSALGSVIVVTLKMEAVDSSEILISELSNIWRRVPQVIAVRNTSAYTAVVEQGDERNIYTYRVGK